MSDEQLRLECLKLAIALEPPTTSTEDVLNTAADFLAFTLNQPIPSYIKSASEDEE